MSPILKAILALITFIVVYALLLWCFLRGLDARGLELTGAGSVVLTLVDFFAGFLGTWAILRVFRP